MATTSKIALFSTEWMNLWKESINNSEAYKTSGKNWDEPLVLKFKEGLDLEHSQVEGFWLNLQKGSCKEIRYATNEDVSKTKVILSASTEVWESLIKEKKDPLFLLMQGLLKLEKGSLLKLTSERASAKALLEAASEAGEMVQHAKTEEIMSESTDVASPVKQMVSKRTSLATTRRGLDMDSFPMQLFQRSKQLGVWDPAIISFEADAQQWATFTDLEKRVLLHLTSMFIAGEEAVTLDLLPLIQTVASEGRIEEEIYLTSFLWEEAKHTEFFALFLDKVVQADPMIESFHGPAYKRLFYDQLHEALERLKYDQSPESQLIASVTYNMIVEGTLAETGYEAYYNMLTDNDMLPGLREGIGLLKRDESRHIAYGLYFIKRLLNEHPHLIKTLEAETGKLIEMALEVVNEIFEPYDVMPFGLEKEWYLNYATTQFSKRMKKLLSSD
jgi:ribonucleoside-diphosphate reductase beta chain